MQKKYYSQYTDYENYTMLANRELEVLKMKNSGMSNTEISEIMNIKYNTVVIYLTRIIQKIDGTFDYEKERMYRNSGAKKRRKDPKYREDYNKYAREYYHKNTEKAKERLKKYRQKNEEKYKEYQREYQKKHPTKWSDLSEHEREKRREYYRDYYRKNHPPKQKEEKITIRKSKSELYPKSNQRAEKIIREMTDGKTVREIAKEQGCSTQNIYSILNRYKKRNG